MPILAVVLSSLSIIFGLRLFILAVQTVFTGKVLIRKGFRTEWKPIPHRESPWRVALRDGLMGLLLIVLGVAFLF